MKIDIEDKEKYLQYLQQNYAKDKEYLIKLNKIIKQNK